MCFLFLSNSTQTHLILGKKQEKEDSKEKDRKNPSKKSKLNDGGSGTQAGKTGTRPSKPKLNTSASSASARNTKGKAQQKRCTFILLEGTKDIHKGKYTKPNGDRCVIMLSSIH